MPDMEIRNPKPEIRGKPEAPRSAAVCGAPAAAHSCFSVSIFHLIPLSLAWPLRLILRTQPRSLYRNLACGVTKVRVAGCVWLNTVFKSHIRFQKYRVAPRLGTSTVRQRLLRNLHQHALLTETGLA